MTADNCRIVLLTGTPIINYPNEIAILFNILILSYLSNPYMIFTWDIMFSYLVH